MSSIAIVICVFFVLMFLGLPISFSLGISSVAYCFVSGQLMYLYMIPEKIFTGMNNFVLLAIPLFMLTGEIMNRGGITEVIVDFCNEAVGRLRGGLGYVNIVASTLFAGITGSALSDVAHLAPCLYLPWKNPVTTGNTALRSPQLQPSRVPSYLPAYLRY